MTAKKKRAATRGVVTLSAAAKKFLAAQPKSGSSDYFFQNDDQTFHVVYNGRVQSTKYQSSIEAHNALKALISVRKAKARKG